MQRLYKIYSGEDLTIAEKIQRRRYQVMVHSCLYYSMNTNMVSDVQYDAWARELEQLQNAYPDIADNVDYAEYFKDFSASTGFDLPLNDPWVRRKALWLSSRLFSTDSTPNEIRRVVQEGKLADKPKSIGQTRKLFSI